MSTINTRFGIEHSETKTIMLENNEWFQVGDTSDELHKNRFVNGSIQVKCEIEVHKLVGLNGAKRSVTFDETDDARVDLVVQIGDRKFNVVRALLTIHSDWFFANTELQKLLPVKSSECKQPKRELPIFIIENGNAEAFHNILEILYGYNILHDENVVDTFIQADEWGFKTIISMCETYLIEAAANVSDKEKFALADKHNLQLLRSHLLSSTSKKAEMVPRNVFDLDKNASNEVLTKLLELS